MLFTAAGRKRSRGNSDLIYMLEKDLMMMMVVKMLSSDADWMKHNNQSIQKVGEETLEALCVCVTEPFKTHQ